jgi:hypothetical protein
VTLQAYSVDSNEIGYFRIFATPPGGDSREITMFRGAPITVSSASTVDPFTDSVASLSCPQITIFDLPGAGDLDWLVPDCDIDIVWANYGAYDYEWSWEGFVVSYDFSMDGTSSSYTIELKGALFSLDDYLAKPTFLRRPLPYEILIQRAFDPDRNPARLKKLKVTFPEDWKRRVPEYRGPDGYESTLKPAGVTPGQLWTGLVSRSTGSWEPTLTGHVQSLLSVMFDDGGSQWTIRNRGGRRPELFLRTPPSAGSTEILEVTLGAPGVQFQGSRDFSQRANVIYGQGKDEAGITYSGMVVAPNGTNTYFKPYAWSPLVYPRKDNSALKRNQKTKETIIRFQDGLDELAATKVAQSQLQRFIDPGITGTLSLSSDPRTADGKPFPRMLIKAGTTFRIKNLLGIREGVLVHVTQASVNFEDLSVSLTVDSKYRDVLTVDEVRARTRDALSPLRSLQVGKFSNTIQDLLYPWSYREGSGIIPSGGGLNAKEFFLDHLPSHAQFPYEEWTKRYPPRTHPSYYVRIGPTNVNNSTDNWSAAPRNGDTALAIPVRMGQAGSIRLTQIAAYDKDGNVVPVRFHVSFYKKNGVGPDAMPQFTEAPSTMKWLAPAGIVTSYDVGNSHPFIKDAWETVKSDGTAHEDDSLLTRGGSEFVVGWGNYYEPAGYSPGRFSNGASRTGILVDDTQWTWDNTDLFDPLGVQPIEEDAGSLFIMIYCDEQGDEPIYFQGRVFRVEPGTQ